MDGDYAPVQLKAEVNTVDHVATLEAARNRAKKRLQKVS